MGKHANCYVQIGQNLRTYRKSIGYLQIDVAVAANLNPTYVSRIETGKARITYDLLVKLVRSLHIPKGVLLKGT